jgi:prolyl-tRNA synthetase
MLWTRTLIPTLRETPEGADVASHVLLLRAGMVSQVMAGAYAYLPLGLRVLRKAEGIIRAELDGAGAIEIALPSMTPAGLLDRAGHLEEDGAELVRLVLRRQDRAAQVVLGASHEEVVADLVAQYVSSYRQLPLVLHGISKRHRNEERPRHGLLRTCEFLVHEAFGLHASADDLEVSYARILSAYCRVFDRCGLEYLVAEAGYDPMGGAAGHELVVPAECGEREIAHCGQCGYTANRELSEIGSRDRPAPDSPPEQLKRVNTPGAATIDEVSRFLGCQPRQLVKTLIYAADGCPVAVLVRGDHAASEAKIRRALRAKRLELATPEMIGDVTGAPVGFAGPVGMRQKIPLWADRDVEGMRNFVVGANQADAHLTGVNLGRDFQPDGFADVRTARDGDACPRCSGTLAVRRAIAVARARKLGTGPADTLGARFRDEHEQQHPIVMGSYQLGIDRLVAAAVEQNHDAQGIVWPIALAPYDVLLVPVNVADAQVRGTADRLHDELAAAGIDVLLDDRDVRAGVKFNDADLIGIPLRVVIGDRGLKQGKLEIKRRRAAEKEMIDVAGGAAAIAGTVRGRQDSGI